MAKSPAIPEQAVAAAVKAKRRDFHVRALIPGGDFPAGYEAEIDRILNAALPHLEAAWRERLLSDKARVRAGRAAYEDFDPTGDWELLEESLRMTWEGNTAAGVEAALDSLPTTPKEER